jgi:solute:Na+ symporter, SSS family
MGLGTYCAYDLGFKGNVYPVTIGGLRVDGYTALWALLVNLGISVIVSAVLNAVGTLKGKDATAPADYEPLLSTK